MRYLTYDQDKYESLHEAMRAGDYVEKEVPKITKGTKKQKAWAEDIRGDYAIAIGIENCDFDKLSVRDAKYWIDHRVRNTPPEIVVGNEFIESEYVEAQRIRRLSIPKKDLSTWIDHYYDN